MTRTRRRVAKAFAKNLREIRIDRGLSQSGLGRLLNKTSPGTVISRLERSERLPSLVMLADLADALNVYPVALIDYR